MTDTDLAFEEALRFHDPDWSPPQVSTFMRGQRAELVDIEPVVPGQPVILDDEGDD